MQINFYTSFLPNACPSVYKVKTGTDCTYFYQFVIKKFIVMRVVLSFKTSAAKFLLVFPRTTASALRNCTFYQMLGIYTNFRYHEL